MFSSIPYPIYPSYPNQPCTCARCPHCGGRLAGYDFGYVPWAKPSWHYSIPLNATISLQTDDRDSDGITGPPDSR